MSVMHGHKYKQIKKAATRYVTEQTSYKFCCGTRFTNTSPVYLLCKLAKFDFNAKAALFKLVNLVSYDHNL